MRKVSIFGSTGSVGKAALDVIAKDKKSFKVRGLCSYSDINTLYHQIKKFKPSFVCVVDKEKADRLSKRVSKRIKIFKGQKGLEQFSRVKSDISVMAISGISCLRPLLINMKHTKRIALANKESMVVAGKFIKDSAKKQKVELIPVDSEINALFQLFKAKKNDFSKVYITASGGPLINHTKKDLKKVKLKEVLDHPTWRMGRRITVDSATLVNKGFEVVEAHYFFDLPFEKIGIVVHKESIIHALVECGGAGLFACLYPTDMKIPISFSLYHPKKCQCFGRVDFANNFSLSFQPIDLKKFNLLRLVLDAAKREDNSLVILNACDEVAIEYFLKKKIKFIDIYKIMEYIYKNSPSKKIKKIDDIFYWDNWARIKTANYLRKLC